MGMRHNRGLAVSRLIAGLIALFCLTIIFVFFDPVVEDSIHAESVEIINDEGSTPDTLIDKY